MSYLAIDHGDVRVGVAISQDGQFAVPLKILINDESLIHELTRLIDEEKVELIVLGRPRSIGGQLGPASEHVEKFREELATWTNVPIVMEDESATTEAAEHKMRSLGKAGSEISAEIDMYAAAEILQGYLDEQK